MKRITIFLAALFLGPSFAYAGSPLAYDQLIVLDAEYLAETGIGDAYERIKPGLSKYIDDPVDIAEHIDSDAPSYSVSAAGERYDIFAPGLNQDEAESWGRATVALFEIVNRQLRNSSVRFYAINGGNDLGGMFLTPDEVEAAKQSLERKTDWPYMPKLDHPWYGQPH